MQLVPKVVAIKRPDIQSSLVMYTAHASNVFTQVTLYSFEVSAKGTLGNGGLSNSFHRYR